MCLHPEHSCLPKVPLSFAWQSQDQAEAVHPDSNAACDSLCCSPLACFKKEILD